MRFWCYRYYFTTYYYINRISSAGGGQAGGAMLMILDFRRFQLREHAETQGPGSLSPDRLIG